MLWKNNCEVARTALRHISKVSHIFSAHPLVPKPRAAIPPQSTHTLSPVLAWPRLYTPLGRAAYGPYRAAQWQLLLILSGTVLAATLAEPYLRETGNATPASSVPTEGFRGELAPVNCELPSTLSDSGMSTPLGHRGTLTAEQEQKLSEFWTLLLKIFDVRDANSVPVAAAPSPNDVSTQIDYLRTNTTTIITSSSGSGVGSGKKSNSKKLHSLFGGSKKSQTDSNTSTSTQPHPSSAGAAENTAGDGDKYGQGKAFQQTLGEMTPEELRSTFWTMVKADHPDALLLRFLRARKWDTQNALIMLVSTLRWRHTEMRVDEDVVWKGEGGALKDSHLTDNSAAKKDAEDFLAQMRKGKSFLHGVDREGRPLCFVRVRLHKSGEQSEKAMERYTVHVIETARLVLRPPVETATILFDMSSFTLSNMDYPPLKFMIKVFEANYPESLGAILVHKSPWVFQSIWTVIKGWLDPVVAGKVHFTKTVEDLEKFIPMNQIVKGLGGDEQWEYHYIEPREDENEKMKDTQTRDRLEGEGRTIVEQFESTTFGWLAEMAKRKNNKKEGESVGLRTDNEQSPSATTSLTSIIDQRNELAEQLNRNYWSLDPYVRARSLYDRWGMIKTDGQVDFYPTRNAVPSQQDAATSSAPTIAATPALKNSDSPTTTATTTSATPQQ